MQIYFQWVEVHIDQRQEGRQISIIFITTEWKIPSILLCIMKFFRHTVGCDSHYSCRLAVIYYFLVWLTFKQTSVDLTLCLDQLLFKSFSQFWMFMIFFSFSLFWKAVYVYWIDTTQEFSLGTQEKLLDFKRNDNSTGLISHNKQNIFEPFTHTTLIYSYIYAESLLSLSVQFLRFN